MLTSATDATIVGHPRREDDVATLARLIADALKDSVAELRREDETRVSQFTAAFQEEISAFRRREEGGIARLEKAATDLKPPMTDNDPTVYKKVADEHDNDLVSKYAGDLNTSLIFAGLFSVITTTFIVRIISNTSAGVVRARSILFVSLSVTLFVAFIVVSGKQWILCYTRVTTWGDTVNRGEERQVRPTGFLGWGLRLVVESLSVLLKFALLLFGIALAVYLWDLNTSVAEVVLGS